RLVDLGRVPMLADAVRRYTFITLREVRGQLRRPAGAAHAALAVDNEIVQVNELAGDQRRKSEDARLRIAAWIGDQRGCANTIAVKLGQSIDGPREVRRVVMSFAVPASEHGGIAQAIIRAEIDNTETALQERRHGSRT